MHFSTLWTEGRLALVVAAVLGMVPVGIEAKANRGPDG